MIENVYSFALKSLKVLICVEKAENIYVERSKSAALLPLVFA